MASDDRIIRKSIFVLARDILIADIIMGLFFSVFLFYLDARDIYGQFSIDDYLPFKVFEFFVIISFQTVLIFSMFALWYYGTYEVTQKHVLYQRGLTWSSEKKVSYDDIESVEQRQGIFGKLMRYGTVVLNTKQGEINMDYIRNPLEISQQIERMKAKFAPEERKIMGAPLPELLRKGEGEYTEFKESLRWDSRNNILNRDLEKAVMKTVAGFMNSSGGTLLIGVDDKGEIRGVDGDLQTLAKKNADGFENHFGQVFDNMIGIDYRQFVKLKFHEVDGKKVCQVFIDASDQPVYMRASGLEEFYVRRGNATHPLPVSKINSYVNTRWKV